MSLDFTEEKDLSEAVRLKWLGHSMFHIEDGNGHRLVTDPYDSRVGYPLPDVEGDIVLVSHGHGDHSNIELVKGNPTVISTTSSQEIDGIQITGYSTFHDSRKGTERGPNIVFKWNMQGLSFVHLGDLGHYPAADLVDELAGPDVLFVPVGGTFTIDGAQAAEVVEMLRARIAVPMHFKNSACFYPIMTEEPFVNHFDSVLRTGKRPAYISREDLPEPTLILVMDYIT